MPGIEEAAGEVFLPAWPFRQRHAAWGSGSPITSIPSEREILPAAGSHAGFLELFPFIHGH
ncbi:hypothetical protein, partial [Schlesneria sp.]|uniref:hypothetical protein n=1 Tax=Schlesneria sp. TaxID=2762018 RepID=UPI002EE7BFDF